jgi:hypothetical protein
MEHSELQGPDVAATASRALTMQSGYPELQRIADDFRFINRRLDSFLDHPAVAYASVGCTECCAKTSDLPMNFGSVLISDQFSQDRRVGDYTRCRAWNIVACRSRDQSIPPLIQERFCNELEPRCEAIG